MNAANLAVLTNVIGAVESGGQVYGKRRYDAYDPPYKNSEKEYTCTLGWYQAYGHEARTLIQGILDVDPDGFRKIDTAGIEEMLSKDWEKIKWNPTSAQKAVLIKLIDSPTGHAVQDRIFADKMKSLISDCARDYTSDIKAQMMYCEIRHLGGKSAVDRIFGRTGGKFDLDSIMASLVKDQKSSNKNLVGSAKYWSRHVKCKQFIEEYAVEENVKVVTEKDIILCGHGSGKPRTIRMDTYLTSRYTQKASYTDDKKVTHTWRKGVVAAVRLKKLTDQGRQKYHDKYKTILGRNKYSQAKRNYCYIKYKDGYYYSDCSSSQDLTFQAIGYDCPTFSTVEMYQSDLFEKLPVVIKNGHIQNPEILKVGDQLLFAGADYSRELHIGHVEGIYEINGQTSDLKAKIKKGQQYLNEFLKPLIDKGKFKALDVDGEVGSLTKRAFIRAFQYGMNKSYNVGLDVDGDYGKMSKAAARNYPTRPGQVSYVVTALEIGMWLHGVDPKGVEFPGSYGSGCTAAVKSVLGTSEVKEAEWNKLFTEYVAEVNPL